MSKITNAELNEALSGFTGDLERYRNFLGLLFTPGVKCLAEKAGAYWLIDAIASHQTAKLDQKCDGFQVWLLTKNAKGKGCTLDCYTDIAENKPDAKLRVVRQKIEYTDFPLEPGQSFRLWVEGIGKEKTLLLPSEH